MIPKLYPAVPFLLSLAVVGCQVPDKMHDQHMAEINEQLAQREAEVRELRPFKGEAERLRAENELLKSQKDIYEALSKDVRDVLDSLRVEGIARAPNGAWVVSTDLLFPSGSSEIGPQGGKIIEKFASAFRGKNLRLRIVGHTDSDPIIRTKDRYPTGTNLELGMYRALKVMERVIQSGISERLICVESKGMSEPVDRGNAPESKRKNRRVEIFVEKA